MHTIIDAHIHLDKYTQEERQSILLEAKQQQVAGMVAVSMDLDSCKTNQMLALQHGNVILPAYGFHPEQALPADNVIADLFAWIRQNAADAVAIGEVGLPYYSALEAKRRGSRLEQAPYIELLKHFIELAKELDLPIVLHAVYEDAATACGLLEEAGYDKAHFHWYKGDPVTTERMARNGYYISFTPDIVYEEEIQTVVKQYPLDQLMAETDGPWLFEGPFLGSVTRPEMLHRSIPVFSKLTGLEEQVAYRLLFRNTNLFYRLNKL
ncbi:TatD family hydrolase [Marinicrinis lubricantis]|uniref:TatD family hydrolase n=1 Tax=Marinicrinis lubricantis TaxID=2086470 RepID=A0ABW1IV80_9BACL